MRLRGRGRRPADVAVSAPGPFAPLESTRPRPPAISKLPMQFPTWLECDGHWPATRAIAGRQIPGANHPKVRDSVLVFPRGSVGRPVPCGNLGTRWRPGIYAKRFSSSSPEVTRGPMQPLKWKDSPGYSSAGGTNVGFDARV